MKPRYRIWIMLAVAALFLPADEAHAAEPRDDLAQIVRLMGYGGGIHDFKNYVLRGRKEYLTAASGSFTQILAIIERLERHTALDSTEDQQALSVVKAMVESYAAALHRATALRDKGWRIEDIDRALIIDDDPAKAALDTLRAKWTWSDFEEIEFQLGYGKAIHNFKDYVVRGHESYHTAALENLLAVDSLIAGQLSQRALTEPKTPLLQERSALEDVERVARAYREHLALIERLIATQRSVRQIDLAVKINDGPAEAGLALLRGQSADVEAQLSKP